jgi:uncharacterized membrane protein
MGRLLGYFARGLVLLAPIVVTGWVCWLVFTRVDGWLGLPVPGVGFVVTIVLITVVGFLGSSLLTRSAVSVVDRMLTRLPFVRLLYGSTRDLLNAFVGEKRRFDQPVVVRVHDSLALQMVGFVTRDTLGQLSLLEHVAVYCPHSYNFSGQLYLVPRQLVTAVDVASADWMAFVVSGGVSGLGIEPSSRSAA